MNVDDRVRNALGAVEQLFAEETIPTFRPRRRKHPTVRGVLAIAMVAGIMVGSRLLVPEVAPEGTVTDLVPRPSATTPPSTVSEGTPVSAYPIDDLASVLDVGMDDGTRLAILLPTRLIPPQLRVAVTSPDTITVEGADLTARASFGYCRGLPEDAAATTVTRTGASAASVDGGVVLCRPDQFLLLRVTTSKTVNPTELAVMDVIPIAIGSRYEELVDLNLGGICCKGFGPVRSGGVVVTAAGYLSGQLIGWDDQTITPRWQIDLGDESRLLGSIDERILATNGRQVVEIDSSSGDQKWAIELTEPGTVNSAAPDRNGTTWYLATTRFTDGQTVTPTLVAVEASNGRIRWRAEGRANTDLQWVDPAVFDEVVVLMDVPRQQPGGDQTETAHLIAFDVTTGNRKWTTDLADTNESYSDRLLAYDADRGVLIVSTPGGTVYSIDPATGKVLWVVETGFAPIDSLEDDAVILRQSTLLRIELSTGALLDGPDSTESWGEKTPDSDRSWSIAYPATWHRADSELMPNLTWDSLTLATFPLRTGGATCAQVPENALRDLGSDDVLISVFFTGIAPGPDTDRRPDGGFDDDVFPSSGPGTDAAECSDRQDLEIHWGPWAINNHITYLLVAFGADVSAETRTQAWEILSSLQPGATTSGGNCVTTRPDQPAFVPPDPYPATPSDESLGWFGTDALWTALSFDGTYAPRKSVWWSSRYGGGTKEPQPDISVVFERIDGVRRVVTGGSPGTGATTVDGWFMIAAIDPRESGCWRVTATYRGVSLGYVYQVP